MNTVAERIRLTELYFRQLEESFKLEWAEAYVAAKTATDWKRRLVLIHPEHYASEVRIGTECPIRGPRSFQQELGMHNRECSSKAIWEYDCPLSNHHESLAGDHFFPFGFGGPTLSSNKVYLCQLHNRIKGADLHFYRWEQPEPEWLPATLLRVAKLKRLQIDG